MAGTAAAKRKAEESKLRSVPNKRFKKQSHYSSGSSDSEDDGHASEDSRPKDLTHRKVGKSAHNQRKRDNDLKTNIEDAEEESEDEGSSGHQSPSSSDEGTESDNESDADADADNDVSTDPAKRRKAKRHDPSVFASSINAILSSKVNKGTNSDPVLSRSKEAAVASHSLAEARLEAKAKRKLKDEKRAVADRGRVRNVLLGDRRRTPGLSESEPEDGGTSGTSIRNGDMSAAEITEQERRLRKTAQRGVVKLFNAVRAAQASSEAAAKSSKEKGVIGIKQREEKVNEMGRQAFLDLVSAGKT